MNQTELTDKLNIVNVMNKQASSLRRDLSQLMDSTFFESVRTLIKNYELRDSKFLEYIKLLEELSFSDEITTPGDIFPGIRTIADSINIEDLNAKVSKLKDISETINSRNSEIESLEDFTINSLKKAIREISEIAIQERKLYDECLDITKKLDSIYDIGEIKSATK